MSGQSFNTLLAKKYGIVEAILIDSQIFWTKTNAAKGENFHDGRFWSYGTPEFFTKYFPYLTSSQIKYALKKLVDNGYGTVDLSRYFKRDRATIRRKLKSLNGNWGWLF